MKLSPGRANVHNFLTKVHECNKTHKPAAFKALTILVLWPQLRMRLDA